jgi:hypothetical protein
VCEHKQKSSQIAATASAICPLFPWLFGRRDKEARLNSLINLYKFRNLTNSLNYSIAQSTGEFFCKFIRQGTAMSLIFLLFFFVCSKSKKNIILAGGEKFEKSITTKKLKNWHTKYLTVL